MSTNIACRIPSNSDVAGIGVRVSVYLQALIVVVDTWLKCKNYDDPNYSEQFEDQGLQRGLLVTSLAIVVSALIEVTSRAGITDYHALVVLNLCLLNYWTGFNLLRAAHESKHVKIRRDSVQPQLAIEQSEKLPPQNVIHDEKTEEPGALSTESKTDSVELPQTSKSRTVGIWICDIALPWIQTWLLFYAHSTAFSALGLVFWINPGRVRFLNYTENPVFNPRPCEPSVVYWAFMRVELTNHSLKYASLFFYAIAAIPVVNGLAIQLLSLITVTILWVIIRILLPIILPILRYVKSRSGKDVTRYDAKSVDEWLDKQLFRWIRVGTRASPLVYVPPVIYWIVATEMLVRSNEAYLGDGVENEWSYGQIVALFAALGSVVVYVLPLIAETKLWIRMGERLRAGGQQQKDERA